MGRKAAPGWLSLQHPASVANLENLKAEAQDFIATNSVVIADLCQDLTAGA
jgi:hypothetical protein